MTSIEVNSESANCSTKQFEPPSSPNETGTSCTCSTSAERPIGFSSGEPSECLAFSKSFSSSLVTTIVGLFKDEHEEVDAFVAELLEQEAGLRRDRTGDDARRRLQNPNLRTTYPADRLTSLNKQILDYRHVIATGLPALVEAALKLEVAEAELARTKELVQQNKAVHEEYREHGIYPQTLAALHRLYSDHGISRHHWVTATDDQLAAIAKVLWTRRDVEDRT